MFENAELATKVRSIQIDGQYWFVMSDVAKVLGYRRVADAKDHLRDSQFSRANRSTAVDLGQQGGSLPTLITESGLYRLMLRSNASNAEPFQIWVEDDVLPTLRREGVKVDQNSSVSDEEIRASVERQLEIRMYRQTIRDMINAVDDSHKGDYARIRNAIYTWLTGKNAEGLRTSGRAIQQWKGKNGPTQTDLKNASNYLTVKERTKMNALLKISNGISDARPIESINDIEEILTESSKVLDKFNTTE